MRPAKSWPGLTALLLVLAGVAAGASDAFIEGGGVRIDLPLAEQTSEAYVPVYFRGKPFATMRLAAVPAQKGYKAWSRKAVAYAILTGAEPALVATLTASAGPLTLTVVQETSIRNDGVILVRVRATSNVASDLEELGVPFVLTDPAAWSGAEVSIWDKAGPVGTAVVLPPTGEGNILSARGTEIHVLHPAGAHLTMRASAGATCIVQDGRAKSWLGGYSALFNSYQTALGAGEERELLRFEVETVPPKTAKTVNLIANGSFERAGNAAWGGIPDSFASWYSYEGVQQKGLPPGASYGLDESAATEGRRSLYLGFTAGMKARRVQVGTMPVGTASDLTHTLSAQMKAEVDGFPVGFLFAGAVLRTTLTREWKRYSFTFRTRTETFAEPLLLDFHDADTMEKGGTVWIDALQLEVGDVANPYVEGRIPRGYADTGAVTPEPGPTALAGRAAPAPIIDGRLDDPAWATAQRLSDFWLLNVPKKASETTEAFVLRDETTLYVGVQCNDSMPDGIRATITERDGALWQDDCIELFVDPARDCTTYYHLAVNALGARYDEKIHDASWNGNWTASARRNPTGWSAEYAIPLAELGLAPDAGGAIGLNLCRQQQRLREFSSWSQLSNGFHEPWRFGSLTGFPPGKAKVAPVETAAPLQSISGRLPPGLVKEGRPFFPLGLYTVPREAFAEVKAAGFNTIIAYEGYYNPYGQKFDRVRLEAYMEGARASGLAVMLGLCRNYNAAYKKIAAAPNLANIEDLITAYKSHPALLGYYLADEPAGDQMQGMVKAVNTLVKKLDPGRPTMLVLCQTGETVRFKGCMDILGVDPYPIPKYPPADVAKDILTYRSLMGDAHPFWAVLQAFGGQEFWYREPTPAEARCMAYLALVHGARGLFWFTYKPCYAPLWNEMMTLNAEISELAPSLLADVVVQTGRAADAPSVTWALRTIAGEQLLLAVNDSPVACTAGLAVSLPAAQVEVQFEGRRLTVENGGLRDRFEPFATHVYRVRKADPQRD